MFSRKCDQEIQTFYLHLDHLYQLQLVSNFLCEADYSLEPSSHFKVIQCPSDFYLKEINDLISYHLMELDSSQVNFEVALSS